MTFTESFKVEAAAPFNFDLTAQIFRNGDPEIRIYREGVFRQVIRLGSRLVLVEVSSVGSVEQPKLAIKLRANEAVTAQDKRQACEVVKYIFNLDFDLGSFYGDIKGEPVMKLMAQQLYGLKNPTTPTVFESLVDSVMEQQISIRVAIALEDKLIKKFGDCIQVDGKNYFAFPTPRKISAFSVEEVRQVGLTQRKAEYIHGAAHMIAAGELDLEGLKNQAVGGGNHRQARCRSGHRGLDGGVDDAAGDAEA